MQKVEIDFGYEEVIGNWLGEEYKCFTPGGTIYGFAKLDLTKSEPMELFKLDDIVCPIRFIRLSDNEEVFQTYHQEYDSLYQTLLNNVEKKYITVSKKCKEIA